LTRRNVRRPTEEGAPDNLFVKSIAEIRQSQRSIGRVFPVLKLSVSTVLLRGRAHDVAPVPEFVICCCKFDPNLDSIVPRPAVVKETKLFLLDSPRPPVGYYFRRGFGEKFLRYADPDSVVDGGSTQLHVIKVLV